MNARSSVKKLSLIVLVSSLMLLGLFVGTTRQAAASSATPHQQALSCYGGAVHFTIAAGEGNAGGGDDYLPSTQAGAHYTTTSRCRDINIKFNNLPENVIMHVCWTRYGTCNANTSLSWYASDANSWHTIATDVLDGTTFTVFIEAQVPPFSTTTGYLAF